ncbi:MAG: hypothetical protein ACTHJR_16485 [Sphingomonas sp.]|uniref:hypothetical protein n=1 Tax=Sphingomonas sp. TaxID=28214 RepID=UPI003F7ED485
MAANSGGKPQSSAQEAEGEIQRRSSGPRSPKTEKADKPDLDPSHTAPAPGATGEKIKVKTTGEFLLYDPYTLEVIEADSEGTEVTRTSFIDMKLESGELKEV